MVTTTYQKFPNVDTNKGVLELAKKLGVKITFTDEVPRAEWRAGLNVLINPKKATNYDILHEISHALCGYGCCREHCEFEAHGGAKVFLKLLGLSKGNAERRIDSYAGWSSHKSCGRVERSKK